AVLVEEQIDAGPVAGAQRQREAGGRGDVHVGGVGQRIGVAALAGEDEPVGDDVVVGTAQRQEAAAGHHHLAGGGVVGGAGDRRHRHVADDDGVAGGIGRDQRRIGTGRPVFRGGEVVGGAAGR